MLGPFRIKISRHSLVLTDNPDTQILLINQIIGHKKINKLMPHTNLRVKGLPVFTVIIIFHQQLV